jgi:hypothetical protein
LTLGKTFERADSIGEGTKHARALHPHPHPHPPPHQSHTVFSQLQRLTDVLILLVPTLRLLHATVARTTPRHTNRHATHGHLRFRTLAEKPWAGTCSAACNMQPGKRRGVHEAPLPAVASPGTGAAPRCSRGCRPAAVPGTAAWPASSRTPCPCPSPGQSRSSTSRTPRGTSSCGQEGGGTGCRGRVGGEATQGYKGGGLCLPFAESGRGRKGDRGAKPPGPTTHRYSSHRRLYATSRPRWPLTTRDIRSAYMVACVAVPHHRITPTARKHPRSPTHFS